MATDAKLFSTAQHRRLLTKSPDKDILMQEYGYMYIAIITNHSTNLHTFYHNFFVVPCCCV